MKPELIPTIARHISIILYSAKRQCCACALAFAILLGLVAVPPSAKGQTLTTLYSFGGVTGDGVVANAGVVRDAAGNLYGTTQAGGTSFRGTVFKVDTTGKETVLYSFLGGTDGTSSAAGVIRDAAGNLYGTTDGGGDLTCFNGLGCGIVFKVDADGNETVLYRFTGGGDGNVPVAGLIRDAAGNLYGTTFWGGDLNCNFGRGCGTVFKLDPNAKETVLYSFTGGRDGAYPISGMIRDKAGNLFGTTTNGGSGRGTVFKLDKAGKLTVLYSFRGGGTDGHNPKAGLLLSGTGLYGTTERGGPSNQGTVFKIDTAGKETLVYRFTGGADGGRPLAGLIQDAAGNLYGTTYLGGTFKSGTVFKLDPTGKETVLYTFTGGQDGKSPRSTLILDATGNLYGTTQTGGAFGGGTVFKLAP